MSVHTFGLAAFRAAIQRNLQLAEFAQALVRSRAELTLMAPATLGIVCFRREWAGADGAETERRGIALIDALESTGTALVSSTRLAGRYDVFIDARPIRTAGPGDHFGELAARDWGGRLRLHPARHRPVRRARPAPQTDQRGLPVAGRHRTDRQGQARRNPGRTPPAALARSATDGWRWS
jgi:hypothetical protein